MSEGETHHHHYNVDNVDIEGVTKEEVNLRLNSMLENRDLFTGFVESAKGKIDFSNAV